MSTGSLKSRLHSLLEPLAVADGYDVEDVVVTPAGNRRLVRVLADRDGGITLDDIATLSRTVSDALDASDLMGATPYVLEVSSPGVDHPLTLARHWRRATGRLVSVSVAGVAGAGQLTARVTGVEGEVVGFSLPDGTEVAHPLSALGKGTVQVEFSRPGVPDDLEDVEELDHEDATAEEVKA
ncbi:MAG: ribosome maturation factor RimP [Frankiales bacterium]|jgi:ribosome maturation factor RimP|nr:ribosome maturation factor RimP [Frankiales bacterium]